MSEATPDNVISDFGLKQRALPAEPAAAAGDVPGALSIHLLTRKLVDAELLLSYAVDAGVSVDPAVYRGILEARAAARSGWTALSGTNLMLASATLAAALKPVSAESLKCTASYWMKSGRRRLLLPLTMGILAAVIVCYSATAFLFSSFSNDIRKNLDLANPLAVKLVSEFGAAPSPNSALCLNSSTTAESVSSSPAVLPAGINRKDAIEDLQVFAGAIRDMYGGSRRMSRLYQSLRFWSSEKPLDPFGFTKDTPPADITQMLELPPGLPNLVSASTERVCVYQRARYYAQSTEESAAILTGAVATCILPVLYALLGAGAYILRRLESQLRSHTFVSESHSPRFITAAIAGAVVGLFNFGQGVSVSPLAIAFLVGYAVDVFFTFLESMILALSKAREVDAAGKSKV